MGSITQSLARGAEAYGARILTGAPVEEILVSGGRAQGIRLGDGRTFHAAAVMSNADPKRTLGKLVPQSALRGSFRNKVEGIDVPGSMARLHLLIDELPHYIGFDSAQLGPQPRGHAILGGPADRLEAAYIRSE